jgi:thioredoxin reductase
MTGKNYFDVIIVGGSYSGLSAAMALGRALRNVLVIDDGLPCNRQTPFSHNFITADGKTPGEISALAKQQVQQYSSVSFFKGSVTKGSRSNTGFEVETRTGERFGTKKLVFATGIRDLVPGIKGYADCWGISVLHCPYCHGYEVRHQKTGILANGDYAFEFACLVSNWTEDLTLFTNGTSRLTADQTARLATRNIRVFETEIETLHHSGGYLEQIVFRDQTVFPLKALYAQSHFEQHCPVPVAMGCELTEEGYIKIDQFQRTTVPGVFACGDNASRMRTVANAVAMGTTAGMMVNKEIIMEEF